MIITKMIGGLGNQMFQWAFGRSLSLSKNTEMVLDTRGYNNQQGLTKRKFELDLFKNLKYKLLNENEVDNSSYWAVVGDNFDYLNATRNIESLEKFNLFLDGYWQSEKYFEEHKDIIYSDFAPSEEEIAECKKLIEPDSVSIHIRRTDYLNLQAIHPVQPISYFNLGIDIIGRYNKLYIFSDEIDWCKTNLSYPNMVFMEGNSNIQDLRLMSYCSHNIISNSSFSWWAAWLNQNPSKTVIAPQNWFGPQASVSSTDILSDNWIKI